MRPCPRDLGLIVVRAGPSEALPYSVAVPGLVDGTPRVSHGIGLQMYRTGFPVSVRFGVKWAENHILLRARPTSGAASQSLAAATFAWFATRRTKYTCSIHLRTPCSRESGLASGL